METVRTSQHPHLHVPRTHLDLLGPQCAVLPVAVRRRNAVVVRPIVVFRRRRAAAAVLPAAARLLAIARPFAFFILLLLLLLLAAAGKGGGPAEAAGHRCGALGCNAVGEDVLGGKGAGESWGRWGRREVGAVDGGGNGKAELVSLCLSWRQKEGTRTRGESTVKGVP